MTLVLESVTKRFGHFFAVKDLSLKIPKGEIFGFLGANGAGKTTSFRMILGLLDSSEGKITWDGSKLDYSTSSLIGYLPEERGLYPKLKVSEQIIYLASLRGMKKSESVPELRKWLDFFEVPEYFDRKVEDLSKGNQQKIQFIAAIIHKPKLLIGTTIVFSSHRMEHVEELCESLCILRKGKVVVYGALKDIKRSFGKKNIILHTDFDCAFLQTNPNVVGYRPTAFGAELQIANETDAEQILKEVVGKGLVRKFALEEPSLHDIFIETVGEKYE
ncbi:MAG: sodium transporter ATP-binding protein [Bacillales bacterium]|nr:sodium transporter ATP-binding protein [Bacillales bacterium]